MLPMLQFFGLPDYAFDELRPRADFYFNVELNTQTCLQHIELLFVYFNVEIRLCNIMQSASILHDRCVLTHTIVTIFIIHL